MKIHQPSLKILMITPFKQVQRGNSRTSIRLCEGLGKRGYEIDLISMEEEGYLEQLQNMLVQKDYTLVHALNASYFSRFAHLLPADIPRILTMTGTDLNCDLAGTSQEAVLCALDSSQAIVVFHPQFKTRLSAMLPSLEDRIYTIPQGVQLPYGDCIPAKNLGINQGDFVFLLPSGLRPVKNLELALDALEIVEKQHPAVKLLIIGTVIDPIYAEKIRRRILRSPWVIYVNEVPHKDIRELFQLGDVVLNTSWSEGQPQAALEAMSLGKPAILTPVPGNLGIITEEEHGFYAATPEEIAHWALTLIHNQELHRELGQNAQRLVQDMYSPEYEFDAYDKLYRQLGIPAECGCGF